MKKGLILYQSKYGATRTYAGWLRDMLDFDCAETPKAVWNTAEPYKTIVLCGGIYASGIAGLSFFRKNAGRLKNRKTAILCVGASPYDEKALQKIKRHNLKNDLNDIPVFYGRGAWDESRMTLTDRTLCRLLQKAVAKKDPDTCEPWMKALLCAAGQAHDWTDPRYLSPLLNYLKD